MLCLNKCVHKQTRIFFSKRQFIPSVQPRTKYFGFPRWLVATSATAKQASTNAVRTALLGNVINTMVKFVAFVYTGSGTMFSESLHSAADSINQSLLLIGVKRSERPATQENPYGFEGERYSYALVSAVGIFFVGSCLSIYHGLNAIIEPEPLQDLWVALGVIGTSFMIETVSFSKGVMACRQGAKENGMKFFEYLQNGPDPMSVTVVLEDGTALLGLTIAFSCIGLSLYTQNPFYDALGSVIIGGLLGCIATFLIRKNLTLLSSRSASQVNRDIIFGILSKSPMVERVDAIKTIQMGADTIKIGAEIQFNATAVAMKHLKPDLVEELKNNINDGDAFEKVLLKYGAACVEGVGDEVDKLEDEIKLMLPAAKHVDLEPS